MLGYAHLLELPAGNIGLGSGVSIDRSTRYQDGELRLLIQAYGRQHAFCHGPGWLSHTIEIRHTAYGAIPQHEQDIPVYLLWWSQSNFPMVSPGGLRRSGSTADRIPPIPH
jgi:hypothetical protein